MSLFELESFRKCSFLVNLLSEMYEQYQIWIKEHPFDHRGFTWENKINSCLITSNFPIDEWSFGDLIWSKFKLTDNAGKVLLEGNEPFGCTATDMSGNAYLVFRGSKSLKDFSSDAQMANIQYEVPSQKKGVRNLFVEKGFYSVYAGLRDDLHVQLSKLLPSTKLLTITGHSLGSALATLAVPDAVYLGFNVKNYNTASPRVGLEAFKEYYESLQVEAGNIPGCLKTIRVVNEDDSVPTLPPIILGYQHIGVAYGFNANYDNDEGHNHDPCCSYAYAIEHPDKPCNPNYGECNFKSHLDMVWPK